MPNVTWSLWKVQIKTLLIVLKSLKALTPWKAYIIPDTWSYLHDNMQFPVKLKNWCFWKQTVLENPAPGVRRTQVQTVNWLLSQLQIFRQVVSPLWASASSSIGLSFSEFALCMAVVLPGRVPLQSTRHREARCSWCFLLCRCRGSEMIWGLIIW